MSARGRRSDERDARAAALAGLTGLPVVEATPIGPGFTNRTDRALLADGRVVVVQRATDIALARSRTGTIAALHPRLRSAGVPVPALLASDPGARVPFVVTEHVPGASGVTMLADADRAAALGREMGRLARLVGWVPTDGLRLPGTWSRPADLVRAAERWLGRARGDLPPDAREGVAALVEAVPDAFAGRPAVLAHGDWAPVNVVVDGGAVVAVVDWESARLADPLFDAAWWGALVFLFHRDTWATAWPAFLTAAGLRLDGPTVRRLRILGTLRVLEVLASARVGRDPVARGAWAGRLVRLLDTSDDPVQP